MPVCGDSACGLGETCLTCPDDCVSCLSLCGDLACSPGETCASCSTDCGACSPVCGDGACAGDETCSGCASDCGACASCGDGACAEGETCAGCPADCGVCTGACGDGVCEPGEGCSSCASDCGEGSSPSAAELDGEEQKLLQLINDYRTQNLRPKLGSCRALHRAAQGHSEDMRDRDYFAHASPDGSMPWDRACAACYAPACGAQANVGENIAAGYPDAASTFTQWKNSPGHDANLLDPGFAVLGIGRATGGGSYGVYWTSVFGGAKDGSCE